MLVYFPHLHEALLPESARQLVRLPDPGLGLEDETRLRLDLPLSEPQARAYVDEALSFGENFRNPGDMAAYLLGRDEEAAESFITLRSELGRLERGEGDNREQAHRMRAQAVLLLAWTMEERLIDVSALDSALEESMAGLRRTLGVEDEDDESELGGITAPAEGANEAPGLETGGSWRAVAGALHLLLPGEAALVTCLSQIADDLKEQGVEFNRISAEDAARLGLRSGRLSGAKLPGRALLGKTRPQDDALLEAERTIYYLEPQAG